MVNQRPEGTEYQSGTSPSGEYLGRNFHVRRSKCIRKYPQQYDPGFGSARECNNDSVESIFNMTQDRGLNRSIDTYDILPLLYEWDAEYCMDA